MLRKVVRRGLPFIGLALASWFAWPIVPDKPQLGDHFLFWFAGHLVLSGASPYDLSSWQLMGTYGPTPEGAVVNVLYGVSDSQLENLWAHPPWTALAMVPFGALPLTVGVLAYHAVLVIAGLAVLVAGAYSVRLRRDLALAVALPAVALSNPFVTAMRTGHFDVLVVLGPVLLSIWLVRARTALVVSGALLAVLKPHAMLLILMTFVAALVIDRVTPVERRTAVRMALAMALSLVVAPYANAYDGVLLAPLVFVAFGFLERHPIALVLAGIAVVVLSWWLSVGLVADWGSQSATAILPVGTLVGTACIALLTRAVTPRSLRISEGDRVSRLA